MFFFGVPEARNRERGAGWKGIRNPSRKRGEVWRLFWVGGGVGVRGWLASHWISNVVRESIAGVVFVFEGIHELYVRKAFLGQIVYTNSLARALIKEEDLAQA